MVRTVESNPLPDFLREQWFHQGKDHIKEVGLVHCVIPYHECCEYYQHNEWVDSKVQEILASKLQPSV